MAEKPEYSLTNLTSLNLPPLLPKNFLGWKILNLVSRISRAKLSWLALVQNWNLQKRFTRARILFNLQLTDSDQRKLNNGNRKNMSETSTENKEGFSFFQRYMEDNLKIMNNFRQKTLISQLENWLKDMPRSIIFKRSKKVITLFTELKKRKEFSKRFLVKLKLRNMKNSFKRIRT